MPLIQARTLANQVEDLLRGRIREGVYAPGSRMPSESELSEELGVSRATVRTVLTKLAVNGLILRKQGDGTYINARVEKISAHLGNIWDFICLIESNGFSPSIQLISKEIRPVTDKEAEMLSIGSGEQLLSLQRLFLADEKPVILTHNIFPLSLLRVSPDEVDGNLHIRDILQTYFDQEIAFVITDIHATLAEEEVGALLSASPDKVMLALDVSFYSKDSILLSLGTNYFDDSVLRLSLVQAWTNSTASL
ncbi:MAG: GntR family transcriptional regulator [Anaerolineales bacterium]